MFIKRKILENKNAQNYDGLKISTLWKNESLKTSFFDPYLT